ncbi:hypothetical protein D1872_297000 [compost metagenome]
MIRILRRNKNGRNGLHVNGDVHPHRIDPFDPHGGLIRLGRQIAQIDDQIVLFPHFPERTLQPFVDAARLKPGNRKAFGLEQRYKRSRQPARFLVTERVRLAFDIVN